MAVVDRVEDAQRHEVEVLPLGVERRLDVAELGPRDLVTAPLVASKRWSAEVRRVEGKP